jgi:hypothetical protein
MPDHNVVYKPIATHHITAAPSGALDRQNLAGVSRRVANVQNPGSGGSITQKCGLLIDVTPHLSSLSL